MLPSRVVAPSSADAKRRPRDRSVQQEVLNAHAPECLLGSGADKFKPPPPDRLRIDNDHGPASQRQKPGKGQPGRPATRHQKCGGGFQISPWRKLRRGRSDCVSRNAMRLRMGLGAGAGSNKFSIAAASEGRTSPAV